MTKVSAGKRRDVIDALRRGTVPQTGLDLLAVGLDRYVPTLDEELKKVGDGSAQFKAIRGDYGTGKTFFTRHLAERALRRGFATAEVQISETETPLHRLETVYRRMIESLRTASTRPSAFRAVIDSWFFALEEDALERDASLDDDPGRLERAVAQLLEERLAAVSSTTPAFGLALRGYRVAEQANDRATADSLVAWMSGQPHIAAAAKRAAGIRGDLDHFGALGFLQGLLTILRDAGHPGLLLVLDEVETLQRVRGDVRDKGLNSLRQLIDEVDSGRFPGLYVAITGTPAFFEGPSGVARLQPLRQRLATDFATDARFDNPRAVQIRLHGFNEASLLELGGRVRDLYAGGAGDPERVRRTVDDAILKDLAVSVAGNFGDAVGVAPRLFLKKLVADVLDRVDQFPDFDPHEHYEPVIGVQEMTLEERALAGRGPDIDDIDLDL